MNKQRKKILLVWPYYPPESGAAAARGKAFAQSLASTHELCILTTHKAKFAPYPPADHIIRLPVQISMRPWTLKMLIDKIHTVVAREKPDAILASIPDVVLGYAAAKCAQKNNVPFYLDSRDLIISNHSLQTTLLRAFARYSYSHARKIFVTTDTQKQLVARLYRLPDKKIVHLPNGIDLKTYPVYSGDSKDCDIIFLGSINPERNIPAIRAFTKRMLSIRSTTTFSFVGIDRTHAFVKNFERSIAKFAGSNVSFTEEVTHAKAFALTKKCRIGLVTMMHDRRIDYQLPVKVYEYMAGGLAITALASREESELHKFVKNNDAGIVAKNPLVLAKSTAILLDNKERLNQYQHNNIQTIINYDRNRILKNLSTILGA